MLTETNRVEKIFAPSGPDGVRPLAGGRRALVRELPADLETPLSVYLKLKDEGPSFLLESVSGGERVARYSFVGIRPRKAFVLKQGAWEIHYTDGKITRPLADRENPLAALRQALGTGEPASLPGLPRLVGGLVGYLGYDTIRYFEPSVRLTPRPDVPEAAFLQADTLVAVDHAFGKLILIAVAEMETSLEEAEARLNGLCERLAGSLTDGSAGGDGPSDPELTSNKTPQEFQAMVSRAQENIKAGDIFQAVLSQRLSRTSSASPLSIYRSLRRLNPSPYMFYFNFGNLAGSKPFHLIGASPEVHVRMEGRRAMLRPIAGTRPRSERAADDQALEQELLSDPKERAEHVMLVDLARNDLGRVCEYGSVRVTEQMTVERYSHVMHLVSQVEGQLRPGLDAFDLLQATFPAGTVSGAPKIRAMQIIGELESQPRGPYGGVVGYLSYDGSMDTCITLRTIVMQGQTVDIQAGAGIVADSDPATEYQETLNKAGALIAAVKVAENTNVEFRRQP
ncbi:MAG TPA: anthranilate synthase component I [Anaerolineales bacterium]|nr:anthranilate synthase component I [Anaerolineales bacterium]